MVWVAVHERALKTERDIRFRTEELIILLVPQPTQLRLLDNDRLVPPNSFQSFHVDVCRGDPLTLTLKVRTGIVLFGIERERVHDFFKRQLDVLDRRLADNTYLCGEEYTIADIAIWPWYGSLVLNRVYEAAEFIDAKTYKNVLRWANQIDARIAAGEDPGPLAGVPIDGG